MPNFTILKPPTTGTAITRKNGRLVVPDDPIIPFIEGDGTGPDIWRASVRVFDAAVEKAFGGRRKLAWMEVLRRREELQAVRDLAAGRNASRRFAKYYVGIKGPLDDARRRRHPIAERRAAANARPVRLSAAGALVHGRAVAGEASRESGHGDLPREHGRHLCRDRVRRRARRRRRRCSTSSRRNFPRSSRRSASGPRRRRPGGRPRSRKSARRTATSGVQVGIGLKPISYLGSERLVHSAISYAIANKRQSVTLVHKGNIMKFTEGAFRDWGYQVAKDVLRRRGDRRRPVVPDS